MTLEMVKVNLTKAFETRQVYVASMFGVISIAIELTKTAVSRATSLEGLKVTGLPRKRFGGADPQIMKFVHAPHLSKKCRPVSQVSQFIMSYDQGARCLGVQ
jgi:hypothetical protein